MTHLRADFVDFHQTHRPTYIRYAEAFLHNRTDAEEAIDDAMEHLLKRWDMVQTSENPPAYAWEVVKNRIRDYGRAKKRRLPTISIEPAAFDTVALRHTSDPIGQLIESMALFWALGTLTERQRDVLVLRYLQDVPPAIVADTLGITRATVRSTVRHACARLRHIYGPDRTMEGQADDSTH
ncbi:sigma-70 family RNA polymerase sigma factor [Streptomyces niveus]|uniref:sigma-70 family RNA polymerase sigma factor n=1 Tax=Streptomyces niveus TaxID=193462 RepID=UPI0033F67893